MNSKLNMYELTRRMMRYQDRVACGPNDRSCDGGIPTFTCPAHGGDLSDRDDFTPEDEAARIAWDRGLAEALR